MSQANLFTAVKHLLLEWRNQIHQQKFISAWICETVVNWKQVHPKHMMDDVKCERDNQTSIQHKSDPKAIECVCLMNELMSQVFWDVSGLLNGHLMNECGKVTLDTLTYFFIVLMCIKLNQHIVNYVYLTQCLLRRKLSVLHHCNKILGKLCLWLYIMFSFWH